MNRRAPAGLDPRTWIFWALVASIVPLIGRNPIPLLTVLLIALIVRESLPVDAAHLRGWSQIIRLSIVFASIGALFNLLTVRTGSVVLVTVPDAVPILSGPVTLNALIYGVLSGLAIVTLVLIGVTISAAIDWTAVLRLLPRSLTGLGVAGSVAFTFVPQMVHAYREIVDARAIRGRELRGVRDYAALAPALLSSGLDRAVTLSALLESRGFGGTRSVTSRRGRLGQLATASGLALVCAAAYLFAVDRLLPAGMAAVAGIALLAVALAKTRSQGSNRTRYRQPVWTGADTAVVAGGMVALAAILAALRSNPAAIRYEPYPDLHLPVGSLALVVGLLGLLVPAVVMLGGERMQR